MSHFAKMVERMEDLVLSGMGVPFTALTIVNSEKLLPQLDRIREAMPEEIRNAKHILDQREEIITDAQQRANQLMMDAKKQAESMLNESELLKAVHEEALRIRQQILTEIDMMQKKAYEESESLRAKAQEEARQVREGADTYADTVLASLDKSLAEFHAVVKNGRKHLKQSQMDAHATSHARTPYATPQPLSPVASSSKSTSASSSGGSTVGQYQSLPGYNQPSPTAAGRAPAVDEPSNAARDRAKIEAFLKQTTLS